jgi:hypothetical protein
MQHPHVTPGVQSQNKTLERGSKQVGNKYRRYIGCILKVQEFDAIVATTTVN